MSATAPIDPRYLRRVLMWEVDVAAMGVKLKGQFPVPTALRPFLRSSRIPAVKYGALARAIESDPAFMAKLAAAATEEHVGPIGMVWLTRPDGWQDRLRELAALEDAEAKERTKDDELHRARKRRDAAEHAQARLQAELIELRERVAASSAELADRDAARRQLESTLAEQTDALRAARVEARNATQRAEAAAAKLEAAHAEIAALRADVVEPPPPPLTDLQRLALTDLAKASAELADRLADLKRQLEPVAVTPSARRAKRAPLVRPGGVRSGTVEEAEHFLRAGGAVLVDGYNVTKQAWPQLDLETQRERLLAVAEDVVRRFGTDLTVVFDGAEADVVTTTPRRLVRVRYSPPGVIADDVIRAEVAEVPASKPVVVVTDDKEILRDVRADGANTIASATFVAAVC